MVNEFVVEIEHVASRTVGWIHPTARPREVVVVLSSAKHRILPETAMKDPRVIQCLNNPNFNSRIRSIKPKKGR